MSSKSKNAPKVRFKNFKESWRAYLLKEICEINPRTSLLPERFIYIDLESVEKGKLLDLNVIDKKKAPSRAQRLLEKGDVLFQTVRPNQKNHYILRSILELPVVASTGFAQLRSKESSEFVYHLLYTSQFNKEVLVRCTGSNYPAINSSDLSEIQVNIPLIEEQKKIASFFSLLDQKIEKQREKIEQLELFKKGMMQKIFSREIRFKDENGREFPEWENKRLRELLEIRDERQVPTCEAPLMAFTSTGGVEEKGDRYNREFLIKDKNKKYKRTELNDLIYSSNNLDVGAIGRNKYGTAVISDVYEIFKAKQNTTPEFLEVMIKQKHFISSVLKFRQGALYGQYRIHADDFLSVEVNVPCLAEQIKIGNFFLVLDRRIEEEEKKLKVLSEQKKGLLQQMFV